MAKIKEKTSVKGMIPAEVVAAAAKEENPAVALYNSLSLKVKPKDETPEQRKAKIMRRQLICGAFGISAAELDTFLEENKNVQAEGGAPSQSDADILRDRRDVSRGQHGAIRGNVRGRIGAIFDVTKDVIDLFFPLSKLIKIVIVTGKFVTGQYFSGKAQRGNIADGTEKDRAYIECLKEFMEKVDVLNQILADEMEEVLRNKKTMKKKEFTEYKKSVIERIRNKMKEHGLEIKVNDLEENAVTNETDEPAQTTEEPQEENPEPEETEKEEERKEPAENSVQENGDKPVEIREAEKQVEEDMQEAQMEV
ncbi:MAG: hypothetical protein E7341_03735 [Clostridiales bacterium]|nr:hypothetical protein [Clostridiales bacterium]